MTKEQADKFIEIIKALQTDGVYSSQQAKGTHDERKEDVEMSNEHKMSRKDRKMTCQLCY